MKTIKKILGVKRQKHINYLYFQLVMQKLQKIEFFPEAPVLQYHQQLSNSCCLSGSASNSRSIGDNRAVAALSNRIEESLSLQTNRFRNRIDFVNDIMMKKLFHKGEQRLRYNLKIWKKGCF